MHAGCRGISWYTAVGVSRRPAHHWAGRPGPRFRDELGLLEGGAEEEERFGTSTSSRRAAPGSEGRVDGPGASPPGAVRGGSSSGCAG